MGIFPAVNLYMIFVHSKLTVSVLTLLKWRASCSLGLIFLLKENKKQNDEVGDSFTEKYWARDSVAGTMWAWGWSEMKGSESHSVVSNSLDPMDYTVHRILQARILEWVAFPFSRDLPNSGTEPRSPALQADSLPAEPPGKPKNTGMDSLSLLQGIFPTQELNRGVLHCRWILYQLSSQGSPI